MQWQDIFKEILLSISTITFLKAYNLIFDYKIQLVTYRRNHQSSVLLVHNNTPASGDASTGSYLKQLNTYFNVFSAPYNIIKIYGNDARWKTKRCLNKVRHCQLRFPAKLNFFFYYWFRNVHGCKNIKHRSHLLCYVG